MTNPFGGNWNYSYSVSSPQVSATSGSQVINTYFDGLGRTIRVEKGDTNGVQSVVQTLYDSCGCTPLGKPWRVSMPYSPGGTPVWTTYTYDAVGRTLTMVAPDGSSTTTYSYAGNMVTITDPSGKWKQYTSDAFGRLTQVTEQSPNSASEPNHVTLYTYDVLDHLLQVRMDRTINGQVNTQYRTWAYNSTTQLLTSQSMPENGTTSYTYNSDSTLATVTDAKSQQKVYSYDTYGRVIQIARGKVANGQFTEDTTQRTTFTYDGTNNGFSSNTAGRVSALKYTGPHGLSFSELYSYHPAGAVTAKQLDVSGTPLGSRTANLEADYTYNNDGNVATVQYPWNQWSNGSVAAGGNQYTMGYDSRSRPNSMIVTGDQYVVNSVSYGPSSEVLQLNATAFTETRTYNANLQMTELVSGSNVHLKYNYSATQNNGRIQSQTDVLSGETVVYTYDSLNRLIQASGSGDPSGAWSQGFTYDGFGNLTQKSGSNAPTNAYLATNPVTNQINTGGAAYDNNGNLTAYGTGSFAVSYSYDNENRLSISTPGGSSETLFGYDQSNQRVYQGTYKPSTAAYSNEQLYFYGADGRKLMVYSLSFSGKNVTITATQTKVWFAGRLVTPQDRLQSQGKYFPYGEDRYNPTPANPSNDTEKFATYTRDSATALDYAYQRYYSNSLGRFQTVDPLAASGSQQLPQSWNRYDYAAGDPIRYNDPTGGSIPGLNDSECGDYNDFSDYDVLYELCLNEPYYTTYTIYGGPTGSALPPQPECDIELYYQSAGFSGDPFNHTYIETLEQINGKVSSEYFEAGPVLKSNTTQLTGSLVAILAGQTWLDQLDKPTNHTTHSYQTTSTLGWQTGFSQSNCPELASIFTKSASYPDQRITYGLTGPNSNSFTHSLLTLSGISVPASISSYLNTWAPGWGTSIKW